MVSKKIEPSIENVTSYQTASVFYHKTGFLSLKIRKCALLWDKTKRSHFTRCKSNPGNMGDAGKCLFAGMWNNHTIATSARTQSQNNSELSSTFCLEITPVDTIIPYSDKCPRPEFKNRHP